MDELVSTAYNIGFTKAVFINGLKIECEPRLRAYCTPERCPNHGQNWVCPPGCGSIEDCADKAKRFQSGILLQSVTGLKPPVDDDVYKSLNRLHNMKLRKFTESIKNKYSEMLTLTTGGCTFCSPCKYPAPCAKPNVRMNSLSAYGIDVAKLCETAEVEYSFRPDMVYYTALVLVKISDEVESK